MKIATIKAGVDKDWQAEEDAMTMARYQEIVGDRTRMQKAMKVARQRAADLSKRADAMQKVASGTSKTGTSKTGTARGAAGRARK